MKKLNEYIQEHKEKQKREPNKYEIEIYKTLVDDSIQEQDRKEWKKMFIK